MRRRRWSLLSSGSLGHDGSMAHAVRAGRTFSMEKVLRYICHAEECQILAITATDDKDKAEYLKLAARWINLADGRRLLLIETRRNTLH